MRRGRSRSQLDHCKRLQVAFGRRLNRLRRETEPLVSQAELAEALGITRASVSNMERGRHRIFLDHLYIAAQVLRRPVTALLPSEEEFARQEAIHTAPDAGIEHVLEEVQAKVEKVRMRMAKGKGPKGQGA